MRLFGRVNKEIISVRGRGEGGERVMPSKYEQSGVLYFLDLALLQTAQPD